jgi:hypothetical protein
VAVLDSLRDSVRLRAIHSASGGRADRSGQLGEREELLGAVALVLQQAGLTPAADRESASTEAP